MIQKLKGVVLKMKCVITRKAVSTDEINLPDFYTFITDKEFNQISIQYGHGASILGHATQFPIPAWTYEFVDYLPSTYIKAGKTTPTEAYEFTQKIIQACYKANQIPYNRLKAFYKEVYRILKGTFPNLKIYCPNATTQLEVLAEDQFLTDLTSLTLPAGYQQKYTDEALDFYARAFDLDRDDACYATLYFHKTKHGYAELPVTTKNPNPSYRSKDHAGYGYAGNTSENGSDAATAPYTLLKDAKPVKLKTNYIQTLEASIDFYLSLPEEELPTFLGQNFIIEHHKIVELTPEEFERRELDTIQDTYQKTWNDIYPYQTTTGEVNF